MTWAEIPRAVTEVAPATPPTELLTWAQVKALLQIQDDVQKTWVETRIITAREKVEADTGLDLVPKTRELWCDAFPADAIELPIWPVRSVTWLKVTSQAGVQSTVASTVYQLDVVSRPARILLADGQAWPTGIRRAQGIVVRFESGYATASAVPGALVLAMEQLLASWYVSRVGAGYVPPPKWLGYDALIAQFRLERMA